VLIVVRGMLMMMVGERSLCFYSMVVDLFLTAWCIELGMLCVLDFRDDENYCL